MRRKKLDSTVALVNAVQNLLDHSSRNHVGEDMVVMSEWLVHCMGQEYVNWVRTNHRKKSHVAAAEKIRQQWEAHNARKLESI